MVTTNDPELAERVAKLRVHGGKKMYHHETVGTNSRLDALQAAILRTKLRHLDSWTAARRGNASVYYKMLEGLEWIAPPQVSEGYGHVYNQFTIRTEHREALRTCLAEHGIGSNVYYPLPLHLQPCFAELGGKEGDLPITESLCAEVLSLPIYPELEVDDVVEVCEVIRTFDP